MSDEQVLGSRQVFDGKLIRVRVDEVRLPNGQVRRREVAEHPGAVGILPVLDDGRLVLVRQYRHAVGRSLLEIPAGTREPGESPEVTARRELIEETGYRAGALDFLLRFYVSPGWANEELFIYAARELTAGVAQPEADESLSLTPIGPDEIAPLIAAGQIADSKSIVALLAWSAAQPPAR
ncbi:MAG TPA: NUDIX hydrolase [Thermomicrobiaceae bacterium]|nr:NUDIX hydrolase [Thermomicrobiaceae bacterium]